MRRIICIAALPLLLAGCATTGGAPGTVKDVGNRICENYHAVKAGLSVARNQAITIPNDNVRNGLVAAIDVSLVALARCPQASEPVPSA